MAFPSSGRIGQQKRRNRNVIIRNRNKLLLSAGTQAAQDFRQIIALPPGRIFVTLKGDFSVCHYFVSILNECIQDFS
jgi:hypothetical protein